MTLDISLPIESSRLLIRPVQEDDIADLMDVNGDEEVTRYLPYPTWRSETDGKAWYRRMLGIMEAGDALQLVITDRSSGRAIGTCLVFHYDSDKARAELGYVMGRRYWRQGFTLEALSALIQQVFATPMLRGLKAEVEPANIASSNLLLKLGFSCEGLVRQGWQSKSELPDTTTYGLLRHEWQARNKGVVGE